MEGEKQIPAKMPLDVRLEAQQWAAIMQILGEAPYRIAAPLIDAITAQIKQGFPQAAAPGNGIDHAEKGM